MKRGVLLVILALAAVGIGAAVAAIASASGEDPKLSWSEVKNAVTPNQGEPEKVHRTVVVDGGEWRFASHKDAAGNTCVSQTVPAEAVGMGCLDTTRLFEDAAVVALPGARQRETLVGQGHAGWHNMWIYGFVRTDVASLEVINMDCSVDPVPFDEQGGFLHVVSLGKINAGVVPYKIRARDAAGSIIHDDNVSLNVPPTARNAGIDKPTPRAECR